MVQPTDWIKIDISESERESAKRRTETDDSYREKYGRTMHFDSSSRFVGHLGEYAVAKFLSSNDVPFEEDSYDYGKKFEYHPDFIINGWRVDVKTGYCKRSISNLPPSYECLIAMQQMAHAIDYFIHIQVTPDYGSAYLIGYIPKSEATKKGFDTSERFINPCYAIAFSELRPVAKLLDELRKEKEGL
jgi:hypothetical protein